MRDAIAESFLKYANLGSDFVVLSADLGYTVFDEFRKQHPTKFFNMGIAENNMVSVAAGIAMSNKKVFAYSIATFLAGKSFEQIRDDICYHNVPAVLIGTGAGFAYGQAGYTHYTNDDIAILRTIPDLVILSPSDPVELRLLFDSIMEYNAPVYLRAGKSGEPSFSSRTELRIGEAYYLHNEQGIAIVSHGGIMEEAVRVRDMLKRDGLDVSLISCPTIKPLDTKFFSQVQEQHSRIIVIEEHYESGGLGSALQEAGIAVEVHGVKDRIYYEGGDQRYLRKLHAIDAHSIYKIIQQSANQ